MVEQKTEAELAAMREAGRVVANALAAAREAASIGVSLKELDEVAHAVIKDAGATSPFLNYHPQWAPTPFSGVICASVNDAIVHGIPGHYRLADGDLVSIDCGATLNGWTGDAAISFLVGTPRPGDAELLATTERGLAAGIEAAVAGGRLGDISHAIGQVGRSAGYGIPSNFGGHGIGREMHEDPFIANEGRVGRGLRLQVGQAFAIEPMFIAGGVDDYTMAPDGWALHTSDRSRAAHFEHSIAITKDGPVILTLP
ncbi:type I methionyl aminopeptidase [Fodinicola feengrottensis]|uniref:Methionine aminopeptidase n=1 Tax=Fodinicola feengrottensis TaxID=435914 RepID=A0ABN2HWD6_9ACTN